MITQEQLVERLCYDQDTGIFTWRYDLCNQLSAGDLAGSIKPPKNYLYIRVQGKSYSAHRLAWLYVYGEFPKGQIDHINQDRLDNRIKNLRVVNNQENQRNSRMYKSNTSSFTGVSFCKKLKKWKAYIRVDCKYIHLGYFPDIKEAIKIRKEANIKYGFHKNHGRNL